MSITAAHAQLQLGHARSNLDQSHFLSLESPTLDQSPLWIGLVNQVDIAPLIFDTPDGQSLEAISYRAFGYVSLRVSLLDRLSLLGQVETITSQAGEGLGPNHPLAEGLTLGRSKLGIKYSTEARRAFGWGIQTLLNTPSQTRDPLYGSQGYSGVITTLMSVKIDQIRVLTNLGYEHRNSQELDGLRDGPLVSLGLGAAYEISPTFSIGLESRLQHTFSSPDNTGAWRQTDNLIYWMGSR